MSVFIHTIALTVALLGNVSAFAGALKCEFALKPNWDSRHCYGEYREEQIRIVRQGDALDVFVDVTKTCEGDRDTRYEDKYTVKLMWATVDPNSSFLSVSVPSGELRCKR